MKKFIFEHAALTFVAVLCAFSYSIIIASAGFGGDLGRDGGKVGVGDEKGDKGSSAYYFNNAVNTDPIEVGNYWYDAEAINQAQEVPDSSVSEVNILENAEYSGDATFIGAAYNSGIVKGNAIFIGDVSENYGDVEDAMTRLYTNEGSTGRDFTTDQKPWTVQIDTNTLDITGATYDNETTFVRSNGGLFISDMTLSEAVADGHTITLQYNKTLNEDSVPSTHDYSLTVNGESVSISEVSVEGSNVSLQVEQKIEADSTVILSYSLGDNLVLSTQGLNGMNFEEIAVQVNTETEGSENPQEEVSVPSSSPAAMPSVSSLSPSILFSQKKVQDVKDVSIIQEKTQASKKTDTAVKENVKEKTEEKVTVPGNIISLPVLEQQEKPAVAQDSNEVLEKTSINEEPAKIWYVPPTQNQRYEISKGNALNIFRSTSLGITNKDLDRIPVTGVNTPPTALGNRLVGRFLLQVENKGQTWYVNASGYRTKVTVDNLVEVTKQSVVPVSATNLQAVPIAPGQ